MKESGILNIGWSELKNIMNKELGVSLDSSVYRKRYRDFRRAYENIFIHLKDNETLDQRYIQVQEKEQNLLKLKKQIQTEKIEYNDWLRKDARDELIIEKINKTIIDLNKSFPLVRKQYINVNNKLNETGLSWVLCFGDAHFGAEVEIKGLYGEILNKYDPEIFFLRMQILKDRVIDIIKKENISELYIFDLGDAIDGILRVSQLMKLRYGVVDATIKYAEYISEWLNDISEYTHIIFRMCNGNHSEIRHLGQKKGSFEKDNMGKVIYTFIKLRLEQNYKIDIGQDNLEFIYENINKYNILVFHGETKNMEEALKNFQLIYKTDIDLLIAGHLHHSYSETIGRYTEVMRIPSIIGIDDYSMRISRSSNPGAVMFALEKEKGKIIEYHIKM